MHFLARCCNLQTTQKKFRRISVQPGLRGISYLRVGRKMANFQVFFFSVRGTGGSPTEPDPENRVGDQENGSPSRSVSSGLQMPGELGHCRAITRPPWWPFRGVGVFSLQNVLQLRQRRWVIIRVSLLLKSRASPETLPFILCNHKRLAIRHMNRPLFPTTLSIASYDFGK